MSSTHDTRGQGGPNPAVGEDETPRKPVPDGALREAGVTPRTTVKEVRSAAKDARDFAQLPALEAAEVAQIPLRSPEFWETKMNELPAAGRVTESRIDAIRRLSDASSRLSESFADWALLRELPAASTDIEFAGNVRQTYVADRADVIVAAEDVLETFGAAREPSRVNSWIARNLFEPRSWPGVLAFGGIVAFALIRVLDLTIYAPFGVSPDEVGRDSIAAIPYAITMLLLLAVVAILAGFVVAPLLFMVFFFFWMLLTGRARRMREPAAHRNGGRPTQDGTSHDRSKSDDDEAAAGDERSDPDLEGSAFETVVRAMPALTLVVALVAVMAFSFFVIVPDVQSSIRDCETQPAGNFFGGGWHTATVVSTDPPLTGPVGTHRLSYLGSGPSHIVLYDCDAKETVRLPKSYSITVDPAWPSPAED